MELPQLTLKIEKLTSEGSGLARVEGKVVFVPQAVPGDTVEAQIENEGKDYDEASLLRITEKSPDRTDPPCPYFNRCGGCQLQHITYEAQLRWKQEIVLDALKRIGHIQDPQVEKIIPSPTIWNYRSRIQLQKDQKGSIGFFQAKSHDVVEIEECKIANEKLNEKLKELLNEFKRKPEDKVSPQEEELKSQVGVLKPETEKKSEKEKIEKKSKDKRSTKETEDKSATGESQWPLELRIDDSTSFTQINPEQNENLVKFVLEYANVQRMDQVFDLFSGSGNFTFPLAGQSGHVWAIEKSKAAIQEGEKRAADNHISNITWKHGSVSRLLTQLNKKGFHCHVLVADPPRRGLDETIEEILKIKPKKIVYVSCNPATFARDVRQFTKSGYSLDKCQPFDMFPQTVHVEIIGFLHRMEP